MTDNEIIKALECCGEDGDGCTGCPRLDAEFGATITSCSAGLATNALSLINRQKAEIDRLEIELQAMRGAANSYKAKVERLQKYDEERDIRLHARLTEKARAEAIKEFAERLKEKFDRYGAEHCFYSIVDDAVKEMGGDDNADD